MDARQRDLLAAQRVEVVRRIYSLFTRSMFLFPNKFLGDSLMPEGTQQCN